MNDIVNLISGLVAIITGLVSGGYFLYKQSSRFKSIVLYVLSWKFLPHFSSRRHISIDIMHLCLIFSLLFLITGTISLRSLLYPSINAGEHQSFFDQTTSHPARFYYPTLTPNKSWASWQMASGNCELKDQTYDVFQTTFNYYRPCYEDVSFHNFLCQVDMQIKRGDAGGILFRENDNRKDFYYLYITESGSYTLSYWIDDFHSEGLVRGTDRDFLYDQVAGKPSRVAIAARNDDLSIYVDGHYVNSVQDSKISDGRLALVAQKILNDTEVIYSRVQIWEL